MLDSARDLTGWTAQNTRGYRPAAITTFRGSADYLLVAHAHSGGHTVVTHDPE